MGSKTNVAALRQHLEQLFPGKWLTGQDRNRVLRTGISDIDNGVIRGLPRRGITEWSGPASSGKVTLLRSAIAYWCLSGLSVAYIDTFSRLVASDWAFVEEGLCGAMPHNLAVRESYARGRFVAVRVSERLQWSNQPGSSEDGSQISSTKLRKEACWVAEQLILSGVFDVVVFDLGESFFVNDRVYARLHRALDKSKASMILIKDSNSNNSTNNWGAQIRANFNWSQTFSVDKGIDSSVMIMPAVKASLSRDGLTQNVELGFHSNVTNSLFTYPQIPDRRTSKTKPRIKG